MHGLEKILEEIEKGAHTFGLLGRDVDFVAIDWVRDIISKYRNEDNEIVEQCPYCENEVALHWDVEKDGYQIFCPNCGKPMMLCSMCDARDGRICDWKEGEGCKHSDERYRDYFRKHMNDGWIPVEERMPERDKTVLACQRGGAIESAWHDGVRWKTGFSHADWLRDVVAWRPLPEPYHPEGSET